MNELKSNVNLPLLYEVRKDAIEKTKDIELGERICDGIDGEDILEIMTSRYWTKHLQGEDALLCSSVRTKVSKPLETAIFTERLNIVPSVEERDLDSYVSDLSFADDFYFQYGQPYSSELLNAIDFHSTGVIYYSVFLKDTRTMIGYVGILPYEDNPAYGEIEFYIFHDFRRQGFSKEALTAFIEAFFTGLLTGVKGTQVEAEILSENEPARKLLEVMGFERISCGMQIAFNEEEEIAADQIITLFKYRFNNDRKMEQE